MKTQIKECAITLSQLKEMKHCIGFEGSKVKGINAKPILFNTDMVKAVLSGRKTVTRRLVKLPSHIKKENDGSYTLHADGDCYENEYIDSMFESGYLIPNYKIGDVLYIRETWKEYTKRMGKGTTCHNKKFIAYKADEDNTSNSSEWHDGNWRPSIHMPKEIARIFLRVTNVTLERVQDITLEEIVKEGCVKEYREDLQIGKIMSLQEYTYFSMIDFENLWNSTALKKDLDKYGWVANPYVWVYEFEVISTIGIGGIKQ